MDHIQQFLSILKEENMKVYQELRIRLIFESDSFLNYLKRFEPESFRGELFSFRSSEELLETLDYMYHEF